MNRYHKQAIVAGIIALVWSIWPADFDKCVIKHGGGMDAHLSRQSTLFHYCHNQAKWGW